MGSKKSDQEDKKALARAKVEELRGLSFSPEEFKPGDQGFIARALHILKKVIEAIEFLADLLDD